MVEPRQSSGLPGRPRAPAGPTGTSGHRFAEPPVLRTVPASSRVCASCAAPVTFPKAPPLCWGCGRTLCVDCYWRHDLTPSAHTCTACRARGLTGPMMARSGAFATPRPSSTRV